MPIVNLWDLSTLCVMDHLWPLILYSLLSLLSTLVHCYQQCVTVHHAPKCMSCHKAIVVITATAHSFYDCMYITPILLLWDLSTLCVVDHLWPLRLCSLLRLLNTPCVRVHHVPKFLRCHKAIVVTTKIAHCFHDCM